MFCDNYNNMKRILKLIIFGTLLGLCVAPPFWKKKNKNKETSEESSELAGTNYKPGSREANFVQDAVHDSGASDASILACEKEKCTGEVTMPSAANILGFTVTLTRCTQCKKGLLNMGSSTRSLVVFKHSRCYYLVEEGALASNRRSFDDGSGGSGGDGGHSSAEPGIDFSDVQMPYAYDNPPT